MSHQDLGLHSEPFISGHPSYLPGDQLPISLRAVFPGPRLLLTATSAGHQRNAWGYVSAREKGEAFQNTGKAGRLCSGGLSTNKMDRVGVGHCRARCLPPASTSLGAKLSSQVFPQPSPPRSARMAKVSHRGDFSTSANIPLQCGSLSTPLQTRCVVFCMTTNRPQASLPQPAPSLLCHSD